MLDITVEKSEDIEQQKSLIHAMTKLELFANKDGTMFKASDLFNPNTELFEVMRPNEIAYLNEYFQDTDWIKFLKTLVLHTTVNNRNVCRI